jgi:hypothetical protein
MLSATFKFAAMRVRKSCSCTKWHHSRIEQVGQAQARAIKFWKLERSKRVQNDEHARTFKLVASVLNATSFFALSSCTTMVFLSEVKDASLSSRSLTAAFKDLI